MSVWTRLATRLSGRPAPLPDPIDHPALARMTKCELADLPMPRPSGR